MRLLLAAAALLTAAVPRGFTPLFNGKDLSGWHISQTNHHGNTSAWKIANGVVTVTQKPAGNGGILLTDKSYKNFEVSLETKPDWGCDGGLFLRSNEKGQAYQVMLDYLEGGNVGGIHGERLEGMGRAADAPNRLARDWRKHWKKDDWNRLRARIEGDIPHIQVWINGAKVVDWTDSANHLPDGATSGMIALQAHRSDPKAKNPRWVPGGYHRHRNVSVKELP